MAAGDFYFAINATFRFILDNYGEEELVKYWQTLGREYYRPLIESFRKRGLEEVAQYWTDFFEQEPGGEVEVRWKPQSVEIDVQSCPAISWLQDAGREIVPSFCRHCYHVNHTIAEEAGFGFEIWGGGGKCFQVFFQRKGEKP